MKRNSMIKVLCLLGALLLVWGCEVADPGKFIGNQKPTVRIVVAPDTGATHDHFISRSTIFNVQWIGHDADGEVIGYFISVDSGPEAFTVKGDSAIAFEAAAPDTANPGKTLPVEHILKVQALDNEGLRSDPATRIFSVINDIPQIIEFNTDFRDGDLVGKGFAFSVAWSDPNPSGGFIRVSLDSLPITDWVTRSAFQFCAVDDSNIVAALNEDVMALDVQLLSNGPHILGVEVRDLGGAISAMRQRRFTVTDTVKPVIVSVTSRYGSSDYYLDGSVFYQENTTTSFTINGSASHYFGGVHSYRYRMRSRELPPADTTWGEWSVWSDWIDPEFTMDNLNTGEYQFEMVCRDWGGVESDVASSVIAIFKPRLEEKTLLIVDESKDGNGRPGSPNDNQMDLFYRYAVQVDTLTWMTPDGWSVSEIDYSLNRVGQTSYISARNVYNKRVIIWHADDKSVFDLSANVRILSEYLDRGGRLILTGWNLLQPFNPGNVDSLGFNTGFAYRYLRIEGGKRTADRSFIGAIPIAEFGYPVLELDNGKIPDRWTGVDLCWTLIPRHLTDGLATWNDAAGNPAFQGEVCIVRNFSPVNPWRTIVLGFPLYFMKDDQAREFISRALSEIDD